MTRCYGLATRSTPHRLTQRTVKTGMSIYRPRRSSNVASSPRNNSLLRTALALQQLAMYDSLYRLATKTSRPISAACNERPAAFNDSTDLSFPLRSSSYIQRLDRLQLSATIVQLHSTTRPISATRNDCPAASNNSTDLSLPASNI